MRESELSKEIRLEASKLGVLLFRNNVGEAWTGRSVTLPGGGVMVADPRRIKFGLCRGSSDLIGLTGDGRFIAVEVKQQRGRVRPEQLKFIQAIKTSGGIAGVCRSVDDFRRLVDESRGI